MIWTQAVESMAYDDNRDAVNAPNAYVYIRIPMYIYLHIWGVFQKKTDIFKNILIGLCTILMRLVSFKTVSSIINRLFLVFFQISNALRKSFWGLVSAGLTVTFSSLTSCHLSGWIPHSGPKSVSTEPNTERKMAVDVSV